MDLIKAVCLGSALVIIILNILFFFGEVLYQRIFNGTGEFEYLFLDIRLTSIAIAGLLLTIGIILIMLS